MTMRITRITAFLIRKSISILHKIYSIICKAISIFLKTLRTTRIRAYTICNAILILLNTFPYCAMDYACCASDYCIFYSISTLYTANNWIQIASWVPNLHITLLLIRINVIIFSQCTPLKSDDVICGWSRKSIYITMLKLLTWGGRIQKTGKTTNFLNGGPLIQVHVITKWHIFIVIAARPLVHGDRQ